MQKIHVLDMHLLNVTCDTYLRARLVRFEELLDSEKYYLKVGDTLAISVYLEENNCYKISLTNPISGLKTWFICKEHVEITVRPNLCEAMDISSCASVESYTSILEKFSKKYEIQKSPMSREGGLTRAGSADESEALKDLQVTAENDWSEGVFYGASDMDDNLGTYGEHVSYVPTQASPVKEADLKPISSTEVELKKFTTGKILFDTSHQMKVGIPDRVSVRIAKTLTQHLFEGLTHTQEIEIESIRISRFMTVILSGDGFKINPLHTNDEQIIEEEEFTQWNWEVTPLRGGKRQLFVNVTIRVKVDNEQGRKDLEALRKEIDITINPAYSIRSFASQYWQWILGSALIPIGLQILSKK